MELIWDPLRKKNVTATPEERVRQWFILQLKDLFRVPEHMMMSESAFRFGDKLYRADIIIYGRDASPLAAVECKRPDVALDASVLEQAMRYNAVLGVRFLILTNGNLTYIYTLKEGRFVPCDHVPSYDEMICRQ